MNSRYHQGLLDRIEAAQKAWVLALTRGYAPSATGDVWYKLAQRYKKVKDNLHLKLDRYELSQI